MAGSLLAGEARIQVNWSMENNRLDILLYAHDGRGLGHASRSVAIGMAIRRLYPHLRVCLVTGCRQAGELIGNAELDWIKLPAYDTEVIDGRSRGIDGPAGFDDKELGRFRAEQIRQIVQLYRPRLVLSDHSPHGKHKELLPALQNEGPDKPQWILGMRGVVGSIAQTRSDTAIDLFKSLYDKLLWYGDSSVLGTDYGEVLGRHFDTEVEECGYVSRLAEQEYIVQPAGYRQYACTVSIPWFSKGSESFSQNLVEAVSMLGPDIGRFRFFVGGDGFQSVRRRLQGLEFCSAELFGDQYIYSICASRSAVIFGGYNSLVDVLTTGIPALVVKRDMVDREQQDHLGVLHGRMKSRLIPVDENACSVELLHRCLRDILEISPDPFKNPVNIGGAEAAARILYDML